jgi:acetyltransferase-like isoleucine patch superfamily enzyme
MKLLIDLYKKCKKSDSLFIIVLIRFVISKVLHNKTLLLHQNTTIRGIKNINAKEKIEIGVGYVGFMHRSDKTFLNIKGNLKFNGKYSIGRGCRFDVGENATVLIGKGGYINCNSSVIIMHHLSIGDNCSISWNCQFLDEDFHTINYENKKEGLNSINIGNHVWIGCGVKIYKGTHVANGCVIASDSVVKGKFSAENCLIGGNPAKVLKENIQWK